MGLHQILKSNPFPSLLIFLTLYISTFLLSSSSCSITSNADEALTQPASVASPSRSLLHVDRHRRLRQEQVFHVKKSPPPPPFLKNKRSKRAKRKKRSHDDDRDRMKAGPFAVMLPKGPVPPSGSSSCHNGIPDSVAALCSLSSGKSHSSAAP
ncbi:uncharacterized protein LOC116205921 [Punica granatum]|uniref:Uncharacterized protein LOC116205921 n=1 Tax=Punica granatum TaxID=22663 RepID=A0A218WL18_PUNGR|nr:uncharacterized protein LOC116205921 [Punica granatum]OWM73070.1 hypothetical protein CDL15_Pgr001184 [Punica granatum]